MIETYRQFKRSTEDKFIELTNESLVDLYKNAKGEYERSQAIGALFIKNFPALIRITSKYDYLESSEKAGKVALELIKSVEDYNSETKFITYLVTRVDNLLLWGYSNRKKKIAFERGVESLQQEDEDYECSIQVEDCSAQYEFDKVEFYNNINKAFDKEINYYKNLDSRVYASKIKRLEFNRKVLEVLISDPSLCASQIARKLGLFRKNACYEDHTSAPDIYVLNKLDKNGNVIFDEHNRPVKFVHRINLVKEANWNRINSAIKELRELFVKYELCPEEYCEKYLSKQQISL